MIIEVKMYTVKCDNCGEEWETDEYSGWNDPDYAWDCASEDDWIEDEKVKDKHYCKECYSYDDDDNVIINSERKLINENERSVI